MDDTIKIYAVHNSGGEIVGLGFDELSAWANTLGDGDDATISAVQRLKEDGWFCACGDLSLGGPMR